jgi:hypothetical protein
MKGNEVKRIFKGQWIVFVNYRDFEEFAKEKYPLLARDYSIAEEEESRNDSLYMYEPDLIDPPVIMEGYPRPYEIFNQLARDEHIEYATYIVNISW